MENKVPPFMYNKSNTTQLILFTALFALLFINLFQPFGSRDWYPNISEFKYLFFSSLIILTGMLVVVISRILMGLYTRKNEISYLKYILWIFMEVFAMSLFYTIFSIYVPQDGRSLDFTVIFKRSAINTSLVLLLPYTMAWLYFSWKEKSKLLENFKKEDTENDTPKKGLIAFRDEKGELKISLMQDSLLYIESADNYATIHYLNKEKIAHFLIRNSLKWIDENHAKDGPLVRCHRSYMVNLDKVKVMRKTKDGIFLELDALNTPDIPVSKTYYEKVMHKFSAYTV